MTEPKPVARWMPCMACSAGNDGSYWHTPGCPNAPGYVAPPTDADTIAALHAQIAERDAEIARLREDAERYRWIRDGGIQGYPGEMDAAIDAARKEQP